LAACFVRFSRGLAFVGIHATLGGGISRFVSAALRAAVGETGFIGLEFELLRTDNADFDGECHDVFYDNARRDAAKSNLGKRKNNGKEIRTTPAELEGVASQVITAQTRAANLVSPAYSVLMLSKFTATR